MPIADLLQKEQAAGAVFGPEDIKALTAAFEEAVKRLSVTDRQSAMATLVAQKIIQLAKEGERNPTRLTENVIQLFRDNPIPDVTL
jgi:hypothetical protein